jgi:hypothetical protein
VRTDLINLIRLEPLELVTLGLQICERAGPILGSKLRLMTRLELNSEARGQPKLTGKYEARVRGGSFFKITNFDFGRSL